MLRDIDKETVDFVPNYDGSEQEPVLIPAGVPEPAGQRLPGIAVGMTTNIPPHNLGETIEAIKLLVANPDVELSELMQVMPGPDFPTAGLIHGMAGIQEAYATGRGRVVMRGPRGNRADTRAARIAT